MEKDTKKVGNLKLIALRKKLTKLTDKMIELYSTPDTIFELMTMRGYLNEDGYYDELMYNTLQEVGVFKVDSYSDLKLVAKLLDSDAYDTEFYELAGFESGGIYLYQGRYIIPIRDIQGEVIAWVGWYPDNRKYVTSTTYGFAKAAYFFNMECFSECWKKNDGVVFLVEGIFDTLALRSLGFSAIGQMGADMSPVKTDMLYRYNKVIAINDNDVVGQQTSKYSGYARADKIWRLPENSCTIKLPEGVKDADDLIKEYNCYEELKSCYNRVGYYKL